MAKVNFFAESARLVRSRANEAARGAERGAAGLRGREERQATVTFRSAGFASGAFAGSGLACVPETGQCTNKRIRGG